MRVSRNRSVPLVAAVAALGATLAAVSCTGSGQPTGAKPGDKTTGPAIAKSDKTVARPGGAKATPGRTPAPVAAQPTTKPIAGEPVPPPRPGAPLPPPAEPTPLGARPSTPPAPVAKTPTPAPAPVAKTPEPPPAPVAKTPEPTPEPVAKTPEPPPAPEPKTTPTPVPPPAPTAQEPRTEPSAPKAAPRGPERQMSEAERLLQERVKELGLEREKRAVLVQTYIENAREAEQQQKWDDVVEWASKAVESDHDNQEAQRLLRLGRKAQGYRDADVASISDLMIQSARVKREQARFTVQNEWDAAMKARAEKNYAAALDHLELALAVIQNDPSAGDWGDREREIRSAIEDMRKAKAAADLSARNEQARQAYLTVKQEEAKRHLADIERRNALLRAAMDAFEHEQYARAETLLKDYTAENPSDQNARQLLRTANRAAHQKVSDDQIHLERERFQQWKLDMEETTVPYHKILTWPSQEHWNRITELRRDAGVISEPVADTPESAATRNKLRTDRISFQVTGMAFSDLVRFINDAKRMNIVVDQAIAPEVDATPVTLSLDNVTIENALKTITKLAPNLTYVVEGSVVFITKADSPLARAKPIIQVHAIGDLTVPLTNFIAPDLNLLPSKAEESEDNPKFGKSTEGIPPFGGPDKVQDLVTKNVATEDYWSSEGVSIAPHGDDKLLVIASPDVQRQVAGFLNDLRAFSGIVVTIETRFLTVTDDFLRDIGVDIRGLGGSSPGSLAVLDDVTNGPPDNASAGFDNGGAGIGSALHPTAGAFFNNNSDGDYRGRTENIFDRALGARLTSLGGAVIQWSLVDDTQLSMILRAVQKTNQGRVLQAPQVTVYNTQRANITLITQRSFIQDFDVEVAQTAFIADPIVGVIQDGFVLDVQPTVSHDRKYITLQLKPTIATLQNPIPTFTTSLGAFTTPVTIQIPTLSVQRAATTVRVPDGGTILLGGLKNINIADFKSETPWLSSVPFAAFFLGRRGSVKEMDNLMVIVKATITDLQEEESHLRR